MGFSNVNRIKVPARTCESCAKRKGLDESPTVMVGEVTRQLITNSARADGQRWKKSNVFLGSGRQGKILSVKQMNFCNQNGHSKV